MSLEGATTTRPVSRLRYSVRQTSPKQGAFRRRKMTIVNTGATIQNLHSCFRLGSYTSFEEKVSKIRCRNVPPLLLVSHKEQNNNQLGRITISSLPIQRRTTELGWTIPRLPIPAFLHHCRVEMADKCMDRLLACLL